MTLKCGFLRYYCVYFVGSQQSIDNALALVGIGRVWLELHKYTEALEKLLEARNVMVALSITTLGTRTAVVVNR